MMGKMAALGKEEKMARKMTGSGIREERSMANDYGYREKMSMNDGDGWILVDGR